MKTRAEIDQMCWDLLDAKPTRQDLPAGYLQGRRPSNFEELGQMAIDLDDFTHAWSEYLHEFFRYKQPGFFTVPPSESLPIERQALLAGAAEYLSLRYGFPIPGWVHDPKYILPEPWDPDAEWTGDVLVEARMQKADPIFAKRKVAMASRGLITL